MRKNRPSISGGASVGTMGSAVGDQGMENLKRMNTSSRVAAESAIKLSTRWAKSDVLEMKRHDPAPYAGVGSRLKYRCAGWAEASEGGP